MGKFKDIAIDLEEKLAGGYRVFQIAKIQNLDEKEKTFIEIKLPVPFLDGQNNIIKDTEKIAYAYGCIWIFEAPDCFLSVPINASDHSIDLWNKDKLEVNWGVPEYWGEIDPHVFRHIVNALGLVWTDEIIGILKTVIKENNERLEMEFLDENYGMAHEIRFLDKEYELNKALNKKEDDNKGND